MEFPKFGIFLQHERKAQFHHCIIGADVETIFTTHPVFYSFKLLSGFHPLIIWKQNTFLFLHDHTYRGCYCGHACDGTVGQTKNKKEAQTTNMHAHREPVNTYHPSKTYRLFQTRSVKHTYVEGGPPQKSAAKGKCVSTCVCWHAAMCNKCVWKRGRETDKGKTGRGKGGDSYWQRERERERKREWKIKTEKRVSSGKRGREEKEKGTESKRVLHVCWFPALSGPCQPVIYGTETGSSLRCQLSIVTTDS